MRATATRDQGGSEERREGRREEGGERRSQGNKSINSF